MCNASSSGFINLDSLISNNDDEEYGPIIKISAHVESQSDREVESGSDSSYGEHAKKIAQDMDRRIAGVHLEQEEKNKRIAAARHQKAKDQEEKQKAFGKSSKKLPGKKSFFSKSLDGESIRKVKDTKSFKPVIKDAESVDNKNDSSAKSKRPRSKKKPLLSESLPTRELKIILPSKLRNVTVQDFDIDSTPSSSSEDFDSQLYNKVENNHKSFKIKSLNRVVNEVDSCSSEDSDDENSQPIKQRFHHSAEKSAAAQRRKRSNYLKKRNSNFKSNKNEAQQNEQSISKANLNQEIISSEPILRAKPLNPQRDKKIKKESTRQSQIAKGSTTSDCSENQKLIKNVMAPKKSNQRRNAGDTNPHTSKEGVGKNEKINYEYQDVKSVDRVVGCSKDSTLNDKSSRNYSYKVKKDILKKDHRLANNPVQNQHGVKQDNVVESSRTKSGDTVKGDNFNNRNSSSDDSIVVIKQVPIVKKEDTNIDKDKSYEDFEKSLRTSDHEIDWNAVDEFRLKRKKVLPQPKDDSEDEIEIDFNALVKNRKAKTPSIADVSKPVNTCHGDSSSELEAQFEACLVKFKQFK